MGDESTSEVEMGNKHGGGGKKKKNKSKGSAETVTSGEVSDSDNEYKYVSIIDVNPPSPQFHSATESLCQSIEVNSPSNGEVLKCSVIIGEKPQENGHSISRVSVNGGDFDEFLDEIPNGSSTFIEKVPNGSSSFTEDIRNSLPSLVEVAPNESPSRVNNISNGFPPKVNEVPNGSPSKVNETPKSSPLLDKVLNGSTIEHLLKRESLKELLGKSADPDLVDDILWGSSIIDKAFSTPNRDEMDGQPSQSSHDNESSLPYEMANGSSQYDDETNEESFSLEDRLERAVRETLGGSGLNESQVQEEVERVVREKLKRQRSGSSDYWNHDDSEDHCIVDFLDKINDHAEARLAAKRLARAEAREIRMRELERMQRESEDGDRVYDVYSTPEAVNKCVRAGSVATPRSLLSANNSYHSSRRSSEDSLEEVNNIRDVRHELKELEEKFRKAMIANAQLDNEKAAVAYQVDLLKDRYEELEEQNLQLLREHKETCRQLEQTRRHRTKLQEDLDVSRSQLSELAQLIQEKGLVVVEGDCSSSDEESEGSQPRPKKPPKKALVSAEVADVLQQGTGSLDVRLKKFVEERNELVDELRRVKLQLEEERAHSRGRHTNGPTDTDEDIQREANKLLGDYKFKLQKAEQDVNTLQANVARLESQVVRYKSAAETSEKLEDELKLEKRKLQRELREAQARVEELETSHSHLQRRLDKLKNAKSALLKDL